MLFDTKVPHVVAQSMTHARTSVWLARHQTWQDLASLLANEPHDVTHRWAQKSHPLRSQEWEAGGGVGYRYYKLVQMVAGRLASAFQRPPETYLYREGSEDALPETDPQVIQWRADEKSVRLPGLLQDIERKLVVLRQVAVMPTMVRGRMRWRTFGPHEMVILPDPEDTEYIEHAPLVALEIRTTDSDGIVRPKYLEWRYSDDGPTWGFRLTDAAGTPLRSEFFADGVNQYGRHPVTLWRYGVPEAGEVLVPPDEPLLHCAVSVNIKLTDLAFGLQYQVHPQAVEYGGAADSASPSFGPNMVRRYADKQTEGFEFVRPDLNLPEYRETIEWWLRMYAVSEGMPPDVFSANSSTRNLGAKQHESEALHVRRASDRISLDADLADTFEAHKTVANFWRAAGVARTQFDADIRLGLNLQPIPQVTDRAQGVQALDAEQAQNLTSSVEREMLASGTSRRVAEARLRQRQAENERFAAPRTEP